MRILSLFLFVCESIGCGLEFPSPPPQTFYKYTQVKVGRGPAYLITVDLNLDGFSDLVSANAENNTLSVLLSKGDGRFKKTLTFPVASEPTAIAVGDINGDNQIDIVDIIQLVNIILSPNPNQNFEDCDINSDMEINIIDVILLVQIILNGV